MIAARPRHRAIPFAALAAILLAGCNALSETVNLNQYGAVNVQARNSSSTTANATATVIFFKAITIAVPNSALQQTDQCVTTSIDNSTTTTRGETRAGSAIALSAGGNNFSLAYVDSLSRYQTPFGQPFSYKSGDVAQFTIPGETGNFPASQISVKLAEPIIPGAVTVPAANAPLSVTWNGTNDNVSAIILQLNYANPATSTVANEQIYCALRDDGAHDFPATLLTAFLASPNALRSLKVTRWRTAEVLPSRTSLLHVASSVDTTLTFR
jgi:hypothetical protein